MSDISEYISHQPEPLILLVDSDAQRLQQAARIIGTDKYRIAIALTGMEACERLALITPDLLILDETVYDSACNAWQASAGQADPAFKIPVLLVIDRFESPRIDQAMTRGVVDLIRRPFTVPELSARVKNLVTGHRAQDIQRKLLEELQVASELINILSVTDSLTGFYNHRGFMPLAVQQLKLARRKSLPMMLAFMDVDGMRQINDQYGHLAGDQLLSDCSTIIRRTFRDSDIIARMGGDEFAVLLVDSSDMKAEQLIERLEGHILQFNTDETRDYRISISIGIVLCAPGQSTAIEELLSRAHELMNKCRLSKCSQAEEEDTKKGR